MSHIFISYSHKDKAYVHKLQQALINEGFEVWIDDRIDLGTTWPQVIQRNLDACSAFIVVMTENAYDSKWVHNEVTRAERKKKPFFALLLSGDTWLSLEAIQYENVTGGKLPSNRFYESLSRVAPRKEEKPVSPPPASNPSGPKRPPLRAIGFSGIILGIVAFSLWALQGPFSPVATATASLTSTYRPTASFTPEPATKTPMPGQMSSASAAPTITVTVSGSMKTSPVDGAQLVYVPGSGDVESFWIDQSAVTTSMFEKFVNAVSYTTDAEKSGVGYVWTSLGEQPATQFPGQTGVVLEWKLISGVDWKNPPRDESRGNGDEILQVSWNDALAYCQWAGRELLRADEWELALATEPSVEFYNTRNGLGEWGQNKATSVYRVVLGYQNIRWGYNLIFQDWGFAENRSANILTFRCKEK